MKFRFWGSFISDVHGNGQFCPAGYTRRSLPGELSHKHNQFKHLYFYAVAILLWTMMTFWMSPDDTYIFWVSFYDVRISSTRTHTLNPSFRSNNFVEKHGMWVQDTFDRTSIGYEMMKVLNVNSLYLLNWLNSVFKLCQKLAKIRWKVIDNWKIEIWKMRIFWIDKSLENSSLWWNYRFWSRVKSQFRLF